MKTLLTLVLLSGLSSLALAAGLSLLGAVKAVVRPRL
jgi:hypothetical protein